jgi:hypothetical protein
MAGFSCRTSVVRYQDATPAAITEFDNILR